MLQRKPRCPLCEQRQTIPITYGEKEKETPKFFISCSTFHWYCKECKIKFDTNGKWAITG